MIKEKAKCADIVKAERMHVLHLLKETVDKMDDRKYISAS